MSTHGHFICLQSASDGALLRDVCGVLVYYMSSKLSLRTLVPTCSTSIASQMRETWNCRSVASYTISAALE